MRRERARVVASRRFAGADKGRAATQPGKVKVAALQSASLIPGRLVVGHRLYRAGDLRSNRSPGTLSGVVTALTAATPDHNLGIEPRSMTVLEYIADSAAFFQCSASGLFPMTDWARHEYPSSRQAN